MTKPFAAITGATQGIGRAIAEKLLAEGFTISVCARSRADLDAARQEWLQKWPDATIYTHPYDVGIEVEVRAFAERVLRESVGEIDILVNNAGGFLQGDLGTEPDGQLAHLMNVNLYSAYHLTRALLPSMKRAKRGHIFNLCSVASLKAYPGGGAYSVTKYALLGFSDNLREELKPDGIRVTALCPGATWSRSWSGSGVKEDRVMEANDVANMLWASYSLSAQANVEMIVMRPQLGDL